MPGNNLQNKGAAQDIEKDFSKYLFKKYYKIMYHGLRKAHFSWNLEGHEL